MIVESIVDCAHFCHPQANYRERYARAYNEAPISYPIDQTITSVANGALWTGCVPGRFMEPVCPEPCRQLTCSPCFIVSRRMSNADSDEIRSSGMCIEGCVKDLIILKKTFVNGAPVETILIDR